jgi:hypothetical protein
VSKKQILKQQQAKWYKILKDEGFEDIETAKGQLKVSSTDRIGRNTFSRVNRQGKNRVKEQETALNVHNAKQDYFYYAEHFLNENEFASEIDKKIWECHSKGMSVDDTFQVLAALSVRSKKQIDVTIAKLIKEMKKAKGIK